MTTAFEEEEEDVTVFGAQISVLHVAFNCTSFVVRRRRRLANFVFFFFSDDDLKQQQQQQPN